MSAASRQAWYWTIIVFILLFCTIIPVWKSVKGAPYIKLGLDLAGGVDLLYRADPPPGSDRVTQQQMIGLVETIRRRIDPEGIKEPIVQQIGDNRLNIQIPGETDPERTKALIGQTALLQFIDAETQPWNVDDIVMILAEGEEPPEEVSDEATNTETTDETEETTTTGETETDETAAESEEEEAEPVIHYVHRNRVIMEGTDLKSAAMGLGEYGGARVDIKFNRQGGRKFAEHTARNVGRYLAIVLDGKVISCPVINSVIPRGEGYISGNFTTQTAQDLATLLQSGSLPVPLTILQSRAVGPSLGQESIDLSLKAALLGLICLIIFMVIYYRLVGLMADIALVFYAFTFLGFVNVFGITLTLPGIAGFILSLGMAVDANVIIFERIKEELNIGKTYRAAIEAGFERAWPAILDANVTTLITGLVLYMVGSGTIKGFAVTLNLGIVISMFSALIVTRSLIYIWSGVKSLQKPLLFGYGVHTQKSP